MYVVIFGLILNTCPSLTTDLKGYVAVKMLETDAMVAGAELIA
jgi:hypothetical protein